VSTFDTDETSISDSQPREFIDAVHGVTRYGFALGDRDILYNGFNYVASPSARGNEKIDQATAQTNFEVTLPANHPLVARYVAMGSPPQQILVTARRLQLTSGQVQQVWSGYVTSLSIQGHLAKFLVPQRTQQALQRRLPTVLVHTSCGNVLYDSWCQVARASFLVSTTVIFGDGRTLKVATMSGNPDQWAQGGELVHVPSGERMTIVDQTGQQLTLQAPIYELHAGDAVQIYAGCAHDIGTCRDKFNNVVNFSGLPQRPTGNPFAPTGLGALETY
jgi:uncharacterized phage protein (TIGR02218 family)